MRADSEVHSICDRYVDDFADADPVMATLLGITGRDDQLTDYSPAGYAARADLAHRAASAIASTTPDDDERIARAVFAERIGIEVELHDAGLRLGALNVIASPVQDVRMVFDVMASDTAEDWTMIGDRLAAVPKCLAGLRDSLLTAQQRGRGAAMRQVLETARQAETWAAGFFATFTAAAEHVPGAPDLARVASAADRAFGELAMFLRTELAPHAPRADAVGEDTYRLWSRYFTGTAVDPHAAYAWGWTELDRIHRELAAVAGRIAPGASIASAAAVLDADTDYHLHGRTALQAWLQETSDRALDALGGVHFEIPDELMALECRIAPPGGGVGAYYVGPSEDFRRPGRMWWSVEPRRELFLSWREISTVYHEGVPGHHLQVATAVREARSLNRFQRLLSFVDGHGEGWALYAERLMRELGFLDEDGALFGMLAEQLFRAARVVLDIGLHLELPIPSGTGFHEGERWTPDLGREFLLTRTLKDATTARDEIARYLGWPGQAAAYKLGEQAWLAAREDARLRAGASFDLKHFHTRALRLGGMGLDTLRTQLVLD
ncbi:DUF885 domain-containing protein [Nocardia caishijiensis]|uniref:Uncharacterized protein (DUF885 family) n=1 Tax=Nocardia caishijiensis TaxID=184756 RepID=A0ABQ6YI43_9NOCA|nr:DUF885 domain-containing protein [Nocardia caishijiensis]KAF0845455.1 uncharacterized protein (DUF885 family) [Nocardia caishijiensis]